MIFNRNKSWTDGEVTFKYLCDPEEGVWAIHANDEDGEMISARWGHKSSSRTLFNQLLYEITVDVDRYRTFNGTINEWHELFS